MSTKLPKIVILDVWGGANNLIHLARSILPLETALEVAGMELQAGYLVSLRVDMTWDPTGDFDDRMEQS